MGFPAREGPAASASGATLSNNEVSNVIRLSKIRKDFIPDQEYSLDKGESCPMMRSNTVS